MIGRYWHTLRHLGPRQVAYRLLRSLPSRKPGTEPPPPLADPVHDFVEPVRREPSFQPPDRFRFLNREERISGPADWSRNDLPLLWLYHLHYFHDLTAAGAEERADALEALILRWIAENPPLRSPAWDPYPVSLRMVSWVKWACLVRPLPAEAVASLALQARHLARSVEYQHRANHLLANAVGLIFAGSYFGGGEGEGWRTLGLEILEREVPAQVLDDGGHVERSPSYHALVLEQLLDVVNVLRAHGHRAPEVVTRSVGPMLAWARIMTHPDGDPPQLNDTALDQGPGEGELRAYAGRLGLEEREPAAWERPVTRAAQGVDLVASGYVRVECGPVTAFLDLAPLGPDYNLAHGHADTLTFELSAHGRRVVVDPGVSTYEIGPQRDLERGTRSHNTVAVNGRDSSEVWASFRVARRARVLGRRIHVQDRDLVVEGAHDGWVRQGVAGLHARRWWFRPGEMVVEDLVDGSGTHPVEIGFLVHPDVEPELDDGPVARIGIPGGGDLTLELDPTPDWALEDAHWAPGFGRRVATVRLVGRARAPLPLSLRCRFRWT